MLYFTNSLGAGIGVLVAGFVMIERLGLPGTMQAAGVAEPGGGGARGAPRARAAPEAAPIPAAPPDRGARADALACCSPIAALTGAASFIYEIAWIRMLTLVLGSRDPFLRADALRVHTRASRSAGSGSAAASTASPSRGAFSASCRS